MGDNLKFALDPAILAQIKAAPSQGNNFNIANVREFGDQILKADVISFAGNSLLTMTNLGFPWLAIVCKTVTMSAIADPFTVRIPNYLSWPGKAPAEPKLPKLGKSPKAGQASNGPPGRRGADGHTGHLGPIPPTPPALYFFTNEFKLQNPGAPVPNFISLSISNLGIEGGEGGDGQPGQDGGDGGDGGGSDWHDPSNYPFDPGCKAGAGSGGRGGDGGNGGTGGDGSPGSAGGTIIYGGQSAAIDLFRFAKLYTFGGAGGRAGQPGPNGRGGDGGARGEHNGVNCGGGDAGPAGTTNPASNPAGHVGAKGPDGKVFEFGIDTTTLF